MWAPSTRNNDLSGEKRRLDGIEGAGKCGRRAAVGGAAGDAEQLARPRNALLELREPPRDALRMLERNRDIWVIVAGAAVWRCGAETSLLLAERWAGGRAVRRVGARGETHFVRHGEYAIKL